MVLRLEIRSCEDQKNPRGERRWIDALGAGWTGDAQESWLMKQSHTNKLHAINRYVIIAPFTRAYAKGDRFLADGRGATKDQNAQTSPALRKIGGLSSFGNSSPDSYGATARAAPATTSKSG
jgi:hypothetical protein